jgi:SecDF, P1 head subdomain
VRLLLAALLLTIGACTADEPEPVAVQPPCALSIVAIPTGQLITEDDPLPPGSQIIASPNDFDVAATTIGDDGSGNPSVTLRLRGDAVVRFARHTANHLGDLIAVTLNGDVVTVPMIRAAIEGGEISISGGSLGADAFADRFAVCVP